MAKVKKAVKKVIKSKGIKNSENTNKFPFIDRYVILRCYYSGVHAGVLVDYDVANDVAILKDARRLWRWKSKFSLSEIAMTGITGEKIAISVPDHMIRQIYEIIPCTKEAEMTIRSIPNFVGSK